ncbi:hypothetical protein JCM30760_07750 [Thiomicrorhabdus hydrogeniphila]
MKSLISVLGTFLVSMWKSLISTKLVKSIITFFTVGFLSKILFVLGISFITYQGTQFTLDFAYNAMLLAFQSMPDAPSQWLTVLFMGASELRVDDALTNILTAYAAAWSIVTTKASSALALKSASA